MSAEKAFKGFSQFADQCLNTLVSLLKVMMRSKFGIRVPQAEGETCVLLGNGPSLKSSLNNNPDFFTKHPLLCVNNFSTTSEYIILKPEYYVILDYAFWLSDGKVVLDTIETLRTKTTWPLQLFIPVIASKNIRFKELCAANNNIRLNFFNYNVFTGFSGISHFFYKKNIAMPQSQNVLVASIYLTINMGFKKIILVGADHSWHQNLHVDENNIVCIKDVHFYDKEETVNFRPFKKGAHLNETFKMHEIMTTIGKVFYGYEVIKKYADSRGAAISNASDISFIDTFDRIKL